MEGISGPKITSPWGLRLRKCRPYAERRRQILDKAAEYLVEQGLVGQTRSLAQACAISQSLLYRFFPSKAALIDEVYEDPILGPFEAGWLARLSDRRQPLEHRLNAFYRRNGFARRDFLRYSAATSLAETAAAPLRARGAQTLPIVVASFTSGFTISFSFINAAGVVAIIPPVILAVLCQRYLVSALTAGAIKG